MRARALSVVVFLLGCGTSSSMPDMAAPTPSSDMAMTTAQSDVAMPTGHADLAKTATPPDLAILDGSVVVPQYSLTVNNTLAWCDVTVTINGHATELKMQSMIFMAPATTTVMLMATPNPTFFPVKWTGVTTMSGAKATYVMTTGATQSVTACCPTTAGGAGC